MSAVSPSWGFKAEVARGLNSPMHTNVMAGGGGGFTGEFLKTGWSPFSEIPWSGWDPNSHRRAVAFKKRHG
jgi:hypothetical protein